MQKETLKESQLPGYSRGEEIFNMVSHIAGGAFAISVLVLCVIFAALDKNVYGVISSAIYGAAMIILYAMSSIYHGLIPIKPKKVFRVIDHCAVYFLIAGTYTPIALAALRPKSPVLGWLLFGIVWSLCALGVVFTAIDLNKYKVFSMICYIGMGWSIIFMVYPVIKLEALSVPAFLWLLGGGISYTVGSVIYGLGKKHKFMHSVFHLFVLLGSVLQFICILFYVL